MADIKEVREAEDAAKEVLRLLDEAEAMLRGARNWGYFDLFSKRSFISSVIKFSKIDRAEEKLRQVQGALWRLQKELGDINLSLRGTLDIGGFQRFLDIAFDNLISDWLTQSRIHESLREIAQLRSDVRQILTRLEQMERQF